MNGAAHWHGCRDCGNPYQCTLPECRSLAETSPQAKPALMGTCLRHTPKRRGLGDQVGRCALALVLAFTFSACASSSSAPPELADVEIRGEAPNLDIRCDRHFLPLYMTGATVNCRAFLRGELATPAAWRCLAAEWEWGDGTTSHSPLELTCTETVPGRVFRGHHKYIDPGLFLMRVRLRDERGRKLVHGHVVLTVTKAS